MDNKNKKQLLGASSSSSTKNLDHLFGPKYSSSSSSSLFGSIFQPSSSVGRSDSRTLDVGGKNFAAPVGFVSGAPSNKGESTSTLIFNKNTRTNYQNETVEPSSYSCSIYYGGQENYSPRSRITQPHHVFKKDKDNDDPNRNDSINSASRGNWWEGSLYY